MEWFWNWLVSSPIWQWFAQWFTPFISYYGCPASKKAKKLQMKQKLYK
ncbi:MAG: hypothetical protein IKH13_06000 [Clostridia bacterium]|nr:hypothetical protein [Clostridia bacterium]